MNNQSEDDKPAAYDTQGRPLYYRPTSAPVETQPQKVEPAPVETKTVSEEDAKRHADSKRKYPELNLSEGEYVINNVPRHPLGLLTIWAATAVVCFVILMVPLNFHEGIIGLSAKSTLFGSIIIISLLVFTVLIGAVATMVYQANKFFLTNESVIQFIQPTLLSKRIQTVNLGSVEDSSFRQVGILQSIFSYGTIRLSTTGDETTYTFTWAVDPKKQVDILNNTVEKFKSGQPEKS